MPEQHCGSSGVTALIHQRQRPSSCECVRLLIVQQAGCERVSILAAVLVACAYRRNNQPISAWHVASQSTAAAQTGLGWTEGAAAVTAEPLTKAACDEDLAGRQGDLVVPVSVVGHVGPWRPGARRGVVNLRRVGDETRWAGYRGGAGRRGELDGVGDPPAGHQHLHRAHDPLRGLNSENILVCKPPVTEFKGFRSNPGYFKSDI